MELNEFMELFNKVMEDDFPHMAEYIETNYGDDYEQLMFDVCNDDCESKEECIENIFLFLEEIDHNVFRNIAFDKCIEPPEPFTREDYKGKRITFDQAVQIYQEIVATKYYDQKELLLSIDPEELKEAIYHEGVNSRQTYKIAEQYIVSLYNNNNVYNPANEGLDYSTYDSQKPIGGKFGSHKEVTLEIDVK